MMPPEPSGRTAGRPALRLGARFALLAASGLACAGCPLEPTMWAARLDAGYVTWTGEDIAGVAATGNSIGLEIAPGDDTAPAMGPIYIGIAYSAARFNDESVPGDTLEHRLGVRARSSTLARCTSSYPYASVGAYLAWLDEESGPGRFGIGVEGGLGLRLGFGPSGHGGSLRRLALDLDMMMSYGYFEAAYQALSTRFGAGLAFGF